MKNLSVLLLVISISLPLWGQSLSIVNPRAQTLLHEWSGQGSYLSVGHFTIAGLEALGLEFAGNERGLNSIEDSPVGMDALEILSEDEMKAYGWCYSINGEVPEAFPDEVALGPQDEVVWFFAYAHYLAGEWIAQCVPVKD